MGKRKKPVVMTETSIVIERQKQEIKFWRQINRHALSYLCDKDLSEQERIERAKDILNKVLER